MRVYSFLMMGAAVAVASQDGCNVGVAEQADEDTTLRDRAYRQIETVNKYRCAAKLCLTSDYRHNADTAIDLFGQWYNSCPGAKAMKEEELSQIINTRGTPCYKIGNTLFGWTENTGLVEKYAREKGMMPYQVVAAYWANKK